MYDNLMYDIWFFLYIIFCESNHHHLWVLKTIEIICQN